MSGFVYRGELTPREMKEGGYEYITCNNCGSTELVWQQTVSDAVCEDCGEWQDGEVM